MTSTREDLNAAQLIYLILDEDSWQSWDTEPEEFCHRVGDVLHQELS